ncbi:hypothetical protein ACI7RC_15870 [Brevibacillus sp. B_LB10_24]
MTVRELPVATTLAGVNMRLTPGGGPGRDRARGDAGDALAPE